MARTMKWAVRQNTETNWPRDHLPKAEEAEGFDMKTRKVCCVSCGRPLAGGYEDWDRFPSCGDRKCDREIDHMIRCEDEERRERAEQDCYERY